MKGQGKYSIYKIPGQVGVVPDQAWKSKDLEKMTRHLIRTQKGVPLPPVTSNRFPKAFQKVSGAFLDASWKAQIANKVIWKDRGTWIICSLKVPCWIIVKE